MKGDVPKMKDGNQSALEPDTLLERYGDQIYSIARGMSNNDADAEDVMQNTLLKILRRRETYRGESNPMGWIYRITINEALEIHRTRSRRGLVFMDEMTHVSEDGGHASRFVREPDQVMASDETISLVRKAVYRLRPDFREAVVLFDIVGLSYRRAAAALHITVATFKTRLHRGRLLLRDRLARTRKELVLDT